MTDGMVMLSDPSKGATARASSTLKRNTKLYGPMNALDYENPSTSWNSEGDSSGKKSSSYILDLGGRTVMPMVLGLQFQAGFAAEEVSVLVQDPESDAWEAMIELEVEDDHDLQIHPLLESSNHSKPKPAKAIKFVFEECTDFYGRIIIYKLQVWGKESQVEAKVD